MTFLNNKHYCQSAFSGFFYYNIIFSIAVFFKHLLSQLLLVINKLNQIYSMTYYRNFGLYVMMTFYGSILVHTALVSATVIALAFVLFYL